MKEHYYSGMFKVFHCFFVKTSITFYYSLFRLSKNLFPYIKYIFYMKKIIAMIYMSEYISMEWGFSHAIHLKNFENRLENTEESKGKDFFFNTVTLDKYFRRSYTWDTVLLKLWDLIWRL